MKDDNQQQSHLQNNDKTPFLLLFSGRILAFITIAVIGYYLIAEHKAHIGEFFASFPWWVLILLLCPLMHLMHGHGGHDQHQGHHRPKKDDENPPEKGEQ